MKKAYRQIELLAPAGSFQGFIGAINGGADAVYLAGNKYGARAFAQNFTHEELEEVLFVAKLFGVKVYLTVNTLLKNIEMNELYDYICPLYEKGLDGVIIQDLGVFKYLKEHFPGLELHASTQMTVTGTHGAEFLTELGMKRVVLSRELTLDEVKNIVEKGIETECFIHGSMCYCYSGQCLFSSMIGGRSGNRGRCAQPCRLPYKTDVSKKEEYCLSLKDMCTLEYLPALIESGIASFKIEGRMKNPAYAAWVTKIYRKYIDRYLLNPNDTYRVEASDLEQLKNLYIRTDLHEGYYHKRHGADMITKESPAYSKTDEDFVKEITASLIECKPRKKLYMQGVFLEGQPCSLYGEITVGSQTYSAYVTGPVVLEALKAPMSDSAIIERLSKTGDTYFETEQIDLTVGENIFLPVKEINELRRKLLDELKETILRSFARTVNTDKKTESFSCKTENFEDKEFFVAFAESEEQLKVILETEYIDRVVIPYGFLLSDKTDFIKEICDKSDKEIYFSLPSVLRDGNLKRVSRALDYAKTIHFGRGVYVNQIDSLSYVRKHYPDFGCICNLNMYALNNKAVDALTDLAEGFTVPVELNKDELRHMALDKGEMILYGRTPLMHTANCIFLTQNNCRRNKETAIGVLKDRMNAQFPYRGHCDEDICYNTIYNSVALSLHKHRNLLRSLGVKVYQLRFTVENREETKAVLDFYKNNNYENVPFAYTNGHFLRGVQ